MRKGYRFEYEVSKTLKEITQKRRDFFFLKLPERKPKGIPMPADFLIIAKGRPIFLECKSSKNKSSFPLKNIRVSQLEYADKIDEAGGLYFFFLSNRSNKKKIKYYLVHFETIFDLIRGKKKSIKWKDLDLFRINLKSLQWL